jgi:hypothetical protein
MSKLTRGIVGVLALCWSLTACRFFAAASLHTNPTRLGSCSVGVGRDATIHGSAADPRLAWAIDNGSGERVELVWPLGYTARFSPALTILDRDGLVVAHEGDLIIGSCLNNDDEPGAIQVDPADIRGPGWQPGDG